MPTVAARAALLERLAARLGPQGWSTDPAVIAPHLVEWRGRYQGTTPFLAMPRTTEEVADIVRACAEARVAITPQGGNTGLVAGQLPAGEILLSLKRMNAIRAIDADDSSLIAEAGVILATVQEAAREAGRRFPLSLASEGSATIGGLVSTNAGGVHVMRYGMMRERVLGLEVVLPSGEVLDALRTLRKDNTGYDVKQLFIGAEGTLGVVTAAALKLSPAPGDQVVAMAAMETLEQALTLFHRAQAEIGGLAAFEIMNRTSIAMTCARVPGIREPFKVAAPFTALLEFEGAARDGLADAVETLLGDALEDNVIFDAAVARSTTQAKEYWRLRESLPAGHRGAGPEASHDISVPLSRAATFLREAEALAERMSPSARIVAFGHLGDGNIHLSVIQKEGGDPAAFDAMAVQSAMHDLAARHRGSISAEHGIGVARRDELPRFKDPAALGLMHTMKAALDPLGIMNPRALFTPTS